MSDQVAVLAGATKALAEVSSASEAWALVRTAEAARRYAQMKGLGHEAINYATGIKAKAMVLLADFIDKGQADGTVRTADSGRPGSMDGDQTSTLANLLGTSGERRNQQAADAVRQARKVRDALSGVDIDGLVKQANAEGEDFGIRGLRRAAAATRTPEPVSGPVPPRPGKYSCIVIDPPWPMPKIERDERPDQGRRLDYPIQSLEDIADEQWVPVRTHAADDCHIYLWVTHKYLPAGLDLLARWGFNYQCVMTWRKNVGITPFSWMYDTEHVLFGRRGNLPLAQLGLRLSFEAPIQGHSVKPDVFYERVTAASPGPRIEMFARSGREGFTAWGNEVTDVASG